jgi:hypothetical protein
VTAIPALFMVATTLASLVLLFDRYVSARNWTLAITDLLLFILAVGVVVMTFRYFYRLRRELATSK